MAAILKLIKIQLPVGTCPGLRSFRVDTPETFKFITGYYFRNNILPKAQEYLKVQIKDTDGENVTELMNISFLTPPDNLRRKLKILRCDPIKAQERTMIIRIENFTKTIHPVSIDFYVKCVMPC